MNYGAFVFIFLIGGTLFYLALRLGLTIYLDYSNAAQVRNQLRQRLKLLQLQPLLYARGMTTRDILYGYPLHQVERLIRQCESCSLKQDCARKLSRGECNFDFCPLRDDVPAGTTE